jgi:hypothetical protein
LPSVTSLEEFWRKLGHRTGLIRFAYEQAHVRLNEEGPLAVMRRIATSTACIRRATSTTGRLGGITRSRLRRKGRAPRLGSSRSYRRQAAWGCRAIAVGRSNPVRLGVCIVGAIMDLRKMLLVQVIRVGRED